MTNEEIGLSLRRIESKIDELLQMFGAEEDPSEPPERTLEGEYAGQERDQWDVM